MGNAAKGHPPREPRGGWGCGLAAGSAHMVRGHAKEGAQQKNAAKQAAMKKSGTQKGAAEKKLNFLCPLCKSTMVNYIQMKQHYDSKHPKERVPEETSFRPRK